MIKNLSDEPSDILHQIAQDESTAPDILYDLAEIGDLSICKSIVYNPSTPPELLAKLYNTYRSMGIRDGLASNPNTPTNILYELADYDYVEITLNLLENPNLPDDLIVRFTDRQYISDIREVAIDAYYRRHPNGK